MSSSELRRHSHWLAEVRGHLLLATGTHEGSIVEEAVLDRDVCMIDEELGGVLVSLYCRYVEALLGLPSDLLTKDIQLVALGVHARLPVACIRGVAAVAQLSELQVQFVRLSAFLL